MKATRRINSKDDDALIDNWQEAFKLLDLIDSEFRSDPMSTQCFDRRIVERVRICVEKYKASSVFKY